MRYKFFKFIFSSILLFFSFAFFAGSSYAISCSPPISGNYTLTESCTFANTVDGVDAGTGTTNTAVMTIPNAVALTVGSIANQTIGWGSITIQRGGSIIINKGVGASLIKGPIYMTDADADGYPASTAQNLSSGKRRNLMTTLSTADCNDNDASKYQNLTNGYPDSDGDTYTSGGLVAVCQGASFPTYNISTSPYRAAANGADCNDSSASVWQNLTGYADADADGYGTSTASQVCSGASLPAGYVSNNTDCYDSNANAKPGQTGWFTTNRGDGSFDYNCDGNVASVISGNRMGYTIPSCAASDSATIGYGFAYGYWQNADCATPFTQTNLFNRDQNTNRASCAGWDWSSGVVVSSGSYVNYCVNNSGTTLYN